MSILFTQFENAGVIRDGEVRRDAVKKLSAKRIFELAEEAAALTPTSDVAPANSIFEHSATTSLSGGRHPCAALECRSRRVEELARFAALYSDRVYIRNPLLDYNLHPERRSAVNVSGLRQNLYEDLLVMHELRPLMEAGRIVAVTPPGNRCPHCLWDRDINSAERAKLEPEYDKVCEEFLAGLRVTVARHGDGYRIAAEADPALLEHGINFRHTILPPELLRNRGLLRRIRSGESVVLGGAEKRSFGLHESFASEVFENVIFELVLAGTLKTSYLTERTLHLRILNTLAGDETVSRRNHAVERHLTALVPFATDVAVSELLTLRNREADSFELFRQHLNSAIDEVRKARGEFSEADARQLYSDVLSPALAGLDRKVAEAQRDLRRSAFRRSATWVGAISFGIYANILPESLSALAGAVGAVKVLQETGEMLLGKADTAKDVRADPLYFLWQARRLGS